MGHECPKLGESGAAARMTTRPAPTSALFHNNEYAIASTVFMASAIGVTIFPGSLLGALVAIAVWRVTRPSIVASWLLGLLGAATAAILSPTLLPAWPWRLLLDWLQPSGAVLLPSAIEQSVAVEALLGPLLVASVQFGLSHAARTIQGQEWLRTRPKTSDSDDETDFTGQNLCDEAPGPVWGR